MRSIDEIKVLEDYNVWVKFDDGKESKIDLSGFLWGEAFESLKDKEAFGQIFIDETRTIAWPNGADLCADVLYGMGE